MDIIKEARKLLAHWLTLTNLLLKVVSSFAFVWLVVDNFGRDIGGGILIDLSVAIGISTVARFGFDQMALRFGRIIVERGHHMFRLVVSAHLTIGITICSIISFALVLWNPVRGLRIGVLAISIVTLPILSAWFKVVFMPRLSIIVDLTAPMLFTSAYIFFCEPGPDRVLFVAALGSALLSTGLVLLLFNRSAALERFDNKKVQLVLPGFVESGKISFFMMLNSMVTYLQAWGVVAIAGYGLSDADAAITAIYIRIASVFSLLLMVVNSYTSPSIAFLYQEKGVSAVEEYIYPIVEKLEMLGMILLLPLSVCLLYLGYFTKLLPFDYSLMGGICILCAAAVGFAVGPAYSTLSMMGGEAPLLYIRILSAIGIIPVLILSGQLGIILFSVSFSLYLVVQRVFVLRVLRTRYGLNWDL